jgi:hypothetical protein
VIAYKTDNRKFFSLIARPEEISVDGHGHILPIKEGVRKFPHPQAVACLYHGLRDLIEFTEFPLLLAGRLSGPMLKPHNLVPACVGWYVADRGRRLEQRGGLSQVTKILNEHLLAPRGEQPANSLARNIRKVGPAVLYFEHAIKGDMSTF